MALIESHKYLFYPPACLTDNEDPDIPFRAVFREFLKTDDLHGNMFLNVIYDLSDYQEYR